MLTTAQVAAKLRIDPSRVRRLSVRYHIGTKLSDRVIVYTEEDVMAMQRHSTGVAGRPVRLSAALDLAADAADERAMDAIRAGDSEGANVTLKLAGHMRRLAQTHQQLDGDQDPVQVARPEET